MQKANRFIDTENEEEFRYFNVYIPKINLAQTSEARTTFSHMKLNFEEKKKEASEMFVSIDNGLNNHDLKSKKLKNLNNFKQDFLFFDSKFVEYNYLDISDKR